MAVGPPGEGKETTRRAPAVRVGFIGLGQMGKPMSGNLVASGFQVTVFDPLHSAVEELVDRGAKEGASARDVAERSQLTVLMVRDATQAEAAVRGEDGFLAGAAEGDTLIVMSTLPPALVRDFGETLSALGVSVLDAPVSGGVEGARTGLLTVMAAGQADVLGRCRPVLEVLGDRIYHVGEAVGLGQTVKVLNQALYFTGLAVSAEAIVIGAKAGIDPDVLVDVIGESSGGNWALKNRAPLAWRNEYRSGGALSIALKDLRAATQLAEDVEVPALVASSTAHLFKLAESLFGAEGDDPLIVKAMEIIGRHTLRREG
jgi:3-hydroxyisobutyrate dehydrogenase-like beta-hydroxyacid dehydrogenase